MSRTRMLVALVAMAMVAGCASDEVVGPDFKYGPPAGGGGGGGEETTTGNNLSNPVIFAEGYGITGLPVTTANPASTGLRTPSTATFASLPDFWIDPASPVETLAGVGNVYCQKTGHTWMPQWATGVTDAVVDWGDNLTSVQFTSTSVVRVETVLFAPGTMMGYQMFLFSGAQKTEQQCTNFAELALQPTVYAVTPRLKLFKVAADGAAPTLGQAPLLDLAVADGLAADGPGYYAAEVNVAGKVVYGYNLFVKKLPVTDKKGWYMLSFSLDPSATVGGMPVARGVRMTGALDARASLFGEHEVRIWIQVKDARDKGPRGGGEEG